MKEKLKDTINTIKNFLFKHKFTKRKAYITGGAAGAVVLAIALTITLSPSANYDTDIEPDTDMLALSDSELAYEPESEYIDGVLVSRQVYAIVVNGEDIVYLISDEDASAVLDGITNRHSTPGSEILNLWFKEDVSIERRDFEWPAPVFPVGEAINYVITGTTAPRIHIIQGGDNLWDIAIANGIRLDTLKEMNPGLNPTRLRIGQEIYLYETQPFISVNLTERVTSQERISYDVIFEDTDSLYRGQTQVRITGSYGSRKIVSEITRENGVETGSIILSEELLTEPVTQVALRGTKPIPVFAGSHSGLLGHPLAQIQVMSPYGNRGGRHHNGVDLRAPTGTPIFAAADGVVIRSTFSGSFGNVVMLCHGDGLQTWYAHNTTNLVSVGDTVVRGQQIATVGSTGNATAPHLHFEVRINGAHRNPMNYL